MVARMAEGSAKYLLLAGLAGLSLYAGVVQMTTAWQKGLSAGMAHHLAALALFFTAALLGILIRYRPRGASGFPEPEGTDPATRDTRAFSR
ncbi:MAG TPA: hypothetical protein VNZ52_01425 [Candidatus Thermoplasmatota archaeon]|nr:hypothetical protein [Candidatus Thermoplasmatota archaeon]